MKSLRFILFTLLIIITSVFPGPCTDRGLTSVVKQLDDQLLVGTQYLFIIAVNRYKDWIPLENPVKDAREIKEILLSRYYIDEVIELYDEQATKVNIINQFTVLKEKLTPDDSLLIFYAGHGYSEEDASGGYWIPVDAGKNNVMRANWLSNYEILDSISGIKANHICLLADSCFSGRLLDTVRDYTKIPDPSDIPYFRKAYKLTSRQVITSGASETVPDTSEFAMQLKKVLQKNTATFLDPVMLYDEVRLGVYGTLPLYGHLKDTGHQEGAAFLLFLKDRLGSIKVRAVERGTLYLNNTFYREIEAGEVLIQNLDQGEYTLTFTTPDGRTEEKTIAVEATAIIVVYFNLPPPGVPSLCIGLSGGAGFPLMDNFSGIVAPSFTVDITSRLTLLKFSADLGMAIRVGGRFVYDTITSDYGFDNNLIFTGPFIGISGGMVMPFIDGFFLWVDMCGGIGYSLFIHEEFVDDVDSWDPFGVAEIELQKRIGRYFLMSLKVSYMGVFYIEDMHHEVLFCVGIGGVI